MNKRLIKEKINERFDNNGPKLLKELGCLINPLLLKFKKEKNQLLVFYFHGLFNSLRQKDLNHVDPQNNIPVNQFEEFIKYFLTHNYNFIRPEDLMSGLKKDQSYIMITFDDGYYNNILAIKTLNKYKVPAVFFITTKNIKENKSFWWDIIYKYRIQEGKSIEAIQNEQAYLKAFKYLQIDEYIENNFGSNSFKPWSDVDRPFTENEIKDFVKCPFVSVGNHTHNHTILTNYSKAEINEELSISNKILFDLTGKVPNTIAFPNGNYNKLVLEATEEKKFRFAFTTVQKKNQLPIEQNNFICLNRFMSQTINIKKYGSFYRLGYNPDILYFDLKKRLTNFIKGKNTN